MVAALVPLQPRQTTEVEPQQHTTMHTEAVSVQAMTGDFQKTKKKSLVWAFQANDVLFISLL
jgi:hypothetical protein